MSAPMLPRQYGAMPSSLIDIATATVMVERAGYQTRIDGFYLSVVERTHRQRIIGRMLITDGEVSRFTVERMLR